MNQGAQSKPVNVGGVDSYARRQNEQVSQVLDQTDYKHFQPQNKPNAEEVDNFGRIRSMADQAKGRKANEDFGHHYAGQEKLQKDYANYDHKVQK